MKRFKKFFAACLVLTLVFLPCAARTAESKGNESLQQSTSTLNVTPKEAWKIIRENKANPRFVLLDVRTPKEFFAGHIAGAVNIDFYSLSFNKELEKLDHSKTYLVYCRSGARSAAAQKVMFKMGFEKVTNMLGGILAWSKKGLPVVKEP